jgi:hypothetical protein
MKFTIWQARHVSLRGRKVVMALAFASLISSFSMAPVLAAGNGDHGRSARNGDHSQRGGHDQRGHHHDYGYRPGYPTPYMYAQPVYAPPPVYYEPPQSPGISLFFPLDIRR